MVGGQRHTPAALSPGVLVPIVQKAGWAPGPVWTDAKNLASAGIQSPDRLARSDSLSRTTWYIYNNKIHCFIVISASVFIGSTAQ